MPAYDISGMCAGFGVQFAQALHLRRTLTRRVICKMGSCYSQRTPRRLHYGLDCDALHTGYSRIGRKRKQMSEDLNHRKTAEERVAELPSRSAASKRIHGDAIDEPVVAQFIGQQRKLIRAFGTAEAWIVTRDLLKAQQIRIGRFTTGARDTGRIGDTVASAARLNIPRDKLQFGHRRSRQLNGRYNPMISDALKIPFFELVRFAQFLACVFALAAPAAAERLPINSIRLPPGFEISVFADNVPNARSMALGTSNVLFVGTRSAGRVYALRYSEGRATRTTTIASGLNRPNGVAFRNGSLYVAEVNRILRLDNIETQLERPPKPVVVSDRYPADTHHGWKFIRFGPDGWLYVPVGAPCNICEPDPVRYALISRIRPDGSGYEVFARGVRNSVGFDWHPETRQLWFTDNGRDWLGDDLPSDELNHAPRAGMHFGYPYCHQGDTPDPEFGHSRRCSEFTPPAVKLGAHVAALGMRFYTGNMFPAEYRHSLFIAEHGSWNRSEKTGYRVRRVRVSSGGEISSEVFAEGWLEGGSAWGRPVDVEVMPDGSLLVSDDRAGAIYRISYRRK